MKLKIKRIKKAPFYFNNEQKTMSIDCLDLPLRASNGLKRAKFDTVGKLMTAIEEKKIDGVKNLGVKSKNEIYTALIKFQISLFRTEEKKDEYIGKLIKMNRPELEMAE